MYQLWLCCAACTFEFRYSVPSLPDRPVLDWFSVPTFKQNFESFCCLELRHSEGWEGWECIWWKKEWEPGCSSVILIHAYTSFSSGLFQCLYNSSPESSTECTYDQFHVGQFWTWLFFSLRLSQSMQGAWNKHLQAWFCVQNRQSERRKADWSLRKSRCPLILVDSSVSHTHFWVIHFNTFLLYKTQTWVSVASDLRQPQWSEGR